MEAREAYNIDLMTQNYGETRICVDNKQISKKKRFRRTELNSNFHALVCTLYTSLVIVKQ